MNQWVALAFGSSRNQISDPVTCPKHKPSNSIVLTFVLVWLHLV